MSHEGKIQFKRWLILAAAWQFMALWICVYDHLVLTSGLASGPAPGYSFTTNLILYSCVTFVASVIGGGPLIFYINARFANRSYAVVILAVVLLIILVMAIITALSAYIYLVAVAKMSLDDPAFHDAFWKIASDSLNLKDTLIWTTITAITQFFFLMSNKFGVGILWKIIRGDYRFPKSEDRIFMFVDLNSSTTIAERLDEINYHRLLKDFFADITTPIVNNDGEIYQYVGDEIVVAWRLDKGVRDNHCLTSFFEMKKAIEKRSDYYLCTYGFVPSFKAGMHSGNVIAGEIGIYKRDITFSGDVLNTTSRIRSMCKEFDVELIVSAELLQKLQTSDRFAIHKLGAVELRGKKNKIELSSLTMAEVETERETVTVTPQKRLARNKFGLAYNSN
jgi:adenylate cyclase